MTYRILVTGSRTWTDEPLLTRQLGLAVRDAGGAANITIIHGACPRGADQIADTFAANHGIKVEPHPANWREHGWRAGFLRNAEMVAAGADLCLAFIAPCVLPRCNGRAPHGSHGADHCARLARQARIPVRRYTS